MGLNQVKLGAQVTVEKIIATDNIQQRLRDFGLVPGTKVVCRYRSPGGQVTALSFRSAVIAMRTRDLQMIRVRC